MKIEHLAFNVKDPAAVAAWYGKNLGFRVVKSLAEPPFTHFIADDAGVMVELYANAAARVLDFPQLHPLELHLAMSSADPDADTARLKAAGAAYVEEVRLADGTHLVMLRDPWGLALQLCKRGTPMR